MNRWVAGARPRTLPAAVVPVVVGAAAAVGEDDPVWWRAGLALVVSLALQVGVNYANDYSDGVRGTDTVRVGPTRLVAGGLATSSEVKRAALAAFGVAALAGLVLAAVTTWWLLAVGVAALLAGWGYTGGPKPYGYMGLGEVFVFVFFGLVATGGTTFVVLGEMTNLAFVAGIPVGLLAVSLLVVNNLRDRPQDAQVGKMTLAVRLGDVGTRALYAVAIVGAFVFAVMTAIGYALPALAVLLAVPLARRPLRAVRDGAFGPELIPVLGDTGRLQLGFGALFALGLALGGLA